MIFCSAKMLSMINIYELFEKKKKIEKNSTLKKQNKNNEE